MKPIIILPPDTMSDEDVQRLRDNGLCVVEAKEPSLVKFMDPIPAVIGRTAVEDAAIQLSRKILRKDFWSSEDTRKIIATQFFDILAKGTKLDPLPSKQETERILFDDAKQSELCRLAREEAKAERAAKKAAAKK
jgi:hypothetical protein